MNIVGIYLAPGIFYQNIRLSIVIKNVNARAFFVKDWRKGRKQGGEKIKGNTV